MDLIHPSRYWGACRLQGWPHTSFQHLLGYPSLVPDKLHVTFGAGV